MSTPRRYPRKKKVQAVTAAAASSVRAAAEATGIPESTVRYWWHSEEFADLRAKTRADLEEPSRMLAYLALEQIKARIAEFKPNDLTILYGVMVDKAQLLGGGPTVRNETVTQGWDDHERAALRDLIDKELTEREVTE